MMKKFAVSWVSFFENDLKIQIVEAIGPVQAIAVAMVDWSGGGEARAWVHDLTSESRTIEEIREEFFKSDQLIAVCPVE